MTKVALLDALTQLIADCTKDVNLPCAVQKGDEAATSRAPDVYRMRLPDSSAAKKIVPYILIQIITGADKQPEGERVYSTATVRFVFAVYSDNEEEGALHLLNLMERVRRRLLEDIVVAGMFQLDLAEGLESLAYPDDTAPYYAGEMIGTFYLPPIPRRVNFDEF